MPLFTNSVHYIHLMVSDLMMDFFQPVDSAAPSQTRLFTGGFTWERCIVEVNCRHIWKPRTAMPHLLILGNSEFALCGEDSS